ncbi:twin-arginine translocase subunit TatC [Candidatus Saganbacteria bacterium]|nr:twin-arginine translocase subunit TatC [Candidatus Saganbacteria bacterium]
MENSTQPFTEHLVELRKRIIYSLVAFGLFSALSWQFVPAIIRLASAPVERLVFLHPAEAFGTFLKVCLWSGFFLSLPVILYNIWRYIESGLMAKEKKYIKIFAPFSFLLFLIGMSFGFFLAIPAAMKFLIGFGQGWVEPMLSVSAYISFIGSLLFIFGASFELPLIILFLTKLGLVNTQSLKHYRKQAILIIFIAAAILTPTPDALTQLLLAVPLIILYELGVLLSRWAN